MAWQPDTDFDYAVLSMQPDHNYGFGQLQFEERERKYFTAPQRPQLTLQASKRNKKQKSLTETLEESRRSQLTPKASERNKKQKSLTEALEEPSRSQIMQGKLKMMEKIQQITGTKPFGEHASLADWENTDNIEAESIAMMRHFGMMSMADGHIDSKATLPITVPTTGVYIVHNGKRRFPLLLDTKYFEPRSVLKDNDNDKSRSSPLPNISTENSSASDSKYFEPNSRPKNYNNVIEKSSSSRSPNTSIDNSSVLSFKSLESSTFDSDESFKSAYSLLDFK